MLKTLRLMFSVMPLVLAFDSLAWSKAVVRELNISPTLAVQLTDINDLEIFPFFQRQTTMYLGSINRNSIEFSIARLTPKKYPTLKFVKRDWQATAALHPRILKELGCEELKGSRFICRRWVTPKQVELVYWNDITDVAYLKAKSETASELDLKRFLETTQFVGARYVRKSSDAAQNTSASAKGSRS